MTKRKKTCGQKIAERRKQLTYCPACKCAHVIECPHCGEKHKARPISQEQFRKLIGRTKATVNNIETGKTLPMMPTLEKMAEVLLCKPADLVGD